jgi:hypothetical protein
MSLRRPGKWTEEGPFHAQPLEKEITASKRVPPVNRIVIIIATVGVFAFVAAAVGGVFRPAVYLLAGVH